MGYDMKIVIPLSFYHIYFIVNICFLSIYAFDKCKPCL